MCYIKILICYNLINMLFLVEDLLFQIVNLYLQVFNLLFRLTNQKQQSEIKSVWPFCSSLPEWARLVCDLRVFSYTSSLVTSYSRTSIARTPL